MNDELKRLIFKYYICMEFPQHEFRHSMRNHSVCLSQTLSSFLLHATLNSKSHFGTKKPFSYTLNDVLACQLLFILFDKISEIINQFEGRSGLIWFMVSEVLIDDHLAPLLWSRQNFMDGALGKERCFCCSCQELKRQEKALKVFIFVFIVDISACTVCDSQCPGFSLLIMISYTMDFFFYILLSVLPEMSVLMRFSCNLLQHFLERTHVLCDSACHSTTAIYM